MDMSQYRDLFLTETREHINNLNKLVVTLEQEPDSRETIDALFREAHSIKGMAATMGYERTARLSHHLEDLLDDFRSSGQIPACTLDYLLAGIDLLDGLLEDLQADLPERDIEAFLTVTPGQQSAMIAEALKKTEQGLVLVPEVNDEQSLAYATEEVPGPEISPLEAGDPVAPAETDTYQVLVDLAEDTPAAAARCVLILRELEKFAELMSSRPDMAALRGGAACRQIQVWLRTSLAKAHIEEALLQISGVVKVRFIDDRRKENRRNRDDTARTIRVRTDLLDQFVNLTGELITQRHMLNTAATSRNWDNLTRTLSQTGRLLDDLHHHVLQARLMPLESITGRLPRIVRDLSHKTGKKVTLQLTGAEVGIDRRVLEELTDPVMHLVRNAIDHGIEQEGIVTVSARREKDLVLVEVADDGQGMDADRLREKALDRGLITTAQAKNLSDREALMLVCQPGFSTAAAITETSGRGVGMDVVKAAVVNLGGTLEILSEPGQGSRFQMRLPLSISIIKILLVSCAGHALAIPITRVQTTLDLATSKIQTFGKQRAFGLEEELISLYSLNAALGLPESAGGETSWVVLTEVQGRLIGLQVDHFLGQREAFVKSLGFPLNLLTGLSGATVEADGQIVFIVDPSSLLEDHQRSTDD